MDTQVGVYCIKVFIDSMILETISEILEKLSPPEKAEIYEEYIDLIEIVLKGFIILSTRHACLYGLPWDEEHIVLIKKATLDTK